ncbi:MAG: OmpA family protein [Cytophagales bacterium]|nr:OmpA family protein [Cytophagales bacterium]
MNYRQVLLSIMASVSGLWLTSQNLVINPGFEEDRPCPYTYNSNPSKEVVSGWFSTDVGTPDFYHRCSTGDVGVPKNWVSIAEPVSGDAYLGFYVFRAKYQETLHARLSQPLIKDTTYLVGAWVNHGSASEYQIRMLNVSLENTPVQFDVKWQPSQDIDFMCWRIKKPEQLGWKQVQLEYKARGGERFLLIGALEPAVRKTAITWAWNKAYRDEPQMDHAAYYFLDDVYVKPKYGDIPEDTPITIPEPAFTLVLEDINFEFDRWILSDSAQTLLQSWSQELEASTIDRVVISGHTDNAGASDYNLRLSQRRAETVKTYLTNLGWPPELIVVQALGESQPVAPNDTPENRSRNRRVVIDVFELGQL